MPLDRPVALDDLSPESRQRVIRLRREIHSGDYDSPQRLEAALDRLLDRLEGSETDFDLE